MIAGFRNANVNRREQRKHIRLHDRDKYMQKYKNNRNDYIGQAEEYRSHLLTRKHISEKTNAERKRPHKMADQLNRNHHNRERRQRTGEMDYILKVVTPDLKSLSGFVNGVLLPHDSVQHVKTAIVLETLKESASLPL